MALNNISPDELKRLFEFIVRFDRIDGSNQVSVSLDILSLKASPLINKEFNVQQS